MATIKKDFGMFLNLNMFYLEIKPYVYSSLLYVGLYLKMIVCVHLINRVGIYHINLQRYK